MAAFLACRCRQGLDDHMGGEGGGGTYGTYSRNAHLWDVDVH